MTTYDEYRKIHEVRTDQAMAMGGPAKLAARAEQGKLNARERLDVLMDPDTFRETGRFVTSLVEADRDKTPADGKITGMGKVDGRPVCAVAYDFTVKGSSSSPVSNKKMSHMKELAGRGGMPLVFLNESTGIRMPDTMGGIGMAAMSSKARFMRRRESPWVAATFGYAFGSACWHTVCSDFAVFRKGTVMAVSSPGLVSRATGETVDGQELGGWKVHAQVTGQVDAVADSDEEAIQLVRRFLSYMPSHNQELPPATPAPAESPERVEQLRNFLPERSAQVYDMRKLIALVADPDTVFELKALYGRSMVTALTRIGGQVVGVIANNPMFKAGAIDAESCDKATSFLVLCDSFNIPILHLVDQPGFLIGLDAERKKIAGKVINWMNALSLVTVPAVTVMVRKNYGQAFVNMGGASTANAVAAWWSTETSFMDPRSAVAVVYGVDEADQPELFAQRHEEMARSSSAYDLARGYGAHEVIDPGDTREFVLGALEYNRLRRSHGIGEHLLRYWPTSF